MVEIIDMVKTRSRLLEESSEMIEWKSAFHLIVIVEKLESPLGDQNQGHIFRTLKAVPLIAE